MPTSPTSSSDSELLLPVPDEDTTEAPTPVMTVIGSSVGQKRRGKSRMSKMETTTSTLTTVKDNLQHQKTVDRETTSSPPSLSTSPEKTTGYYFDTPGISVHICIFDKKHYIKHLPNLFTHSLPPFSWVQYELHWSRGLYWDAPGRLIWFSHKLHLPGYCISGLWSWDSGLYFFI